MNETVKTAVFVAVAVAIVLITFVCFNGAKGPEVAAPEGADLEGKPLFPKFTDPLAATSLEVVKYDDETASAVPFKVAQVDDAWSIPSHENYPADAEDQLGEAAAGMVGLKVVDMASDDPDTHPMYGVVDPESKLGSTDAEDVGVRVVMSDKDDKMLMGLVIGKQVPDRNDLRYVRVVGENPVYTMEVKIDKLSTRFEDWIEEDLLKLSSWDVRKVHVRDYSMLEQGGRIQVDPGNELTLEYDDTGDPKWALVEDRVFDPKAGKMADAKMGDDEELDTEKLDEMKNNLDDLEIVDVRRKPEGLSGDLRSAGTLRNDMQTILSLQSRGFYLVELPVGDKVYMELMSNKGELQVSTKDGVQYVLRFGEIASGATGDAGEDSADDGEDADTEDGEGLEDDEESDGGGLNRYLFVMAQYDSHMIPQPELDPMPEAPKPEEEGEKAEEGEDGDEKAADEDADGEEEADEAAADDEEEGEDEGDEKSQAQQGYEDELARVTRENQRKQDEYDEKVKEAKEEVEKLNARFADWYYVISDEVYQKIRLARDDIVKKKEKEEGDEATGADAADPAAGDLSPAVLDALRQAAPGGSE